MGDRAPFQAAALTMRGGAVEPLKDVDGESCLSLQTVVVKNGKIFIDSIDEVNNDASGEKQRLEEELDCLAGSDDDDDVDSTSFSEEDFESFMQASDSDEDISDTRTWTQQEDEEEMTYKHQDYISYEFHETSTDTDTTHGSGTGDCQKSMAFGRTYSFSNGHQSVSRKTSDPGGRNVQTNDEKSMFGDEIEKLLREDFDSSWRYVPLYPENYYSSGQDVQRTSVIADLPNLLRDNSEECMRRVIPKVREILYVANTDIQLAAATAFLQILEKNLVSVEEYKKSFLQTILTSVDNKNEEVSSAWLETLLNCIDLLPQDVVEKDVLSIAVSKGQLCQTLRARLSCCKILGKVSSKFGNFVIKNDVLPVVLSLCGDVEYEVRACMCQRLDAVAHGLGLELTKSKLLPQLIELSEDESHNVICACLEATANIIAMLDREACVNVIVPVVKELLEKAMSNVYSILPVASRLFGRLCHSLLDYLSMDDKTYFLEYFKKLCRTGIVERKDKEAARKLVESVYMAETASDATVETRRNAAYNFPAMVLFTEAKEFRLKLYPSFIQLCVDPQLVVRKAMAAGFHEVTKLLGTDADVVFPELSAFLNDPDIEILKVIVPTFQDIMSPLAAAGVDEFDEQRAHAIQDVVTNFLRVEGILFRSPCWRVQEAMLQSMQCLHQLCSSEFVYNKALPLLLDKLRNGRALPVKVAAAKAVTVLSRHLKYRAQREEVVQILIDEFHKSKSCYCRSLFIDFAHCYLQTNSKQAFKERFFDHILNMKSDHVTTVRLKMLTIFPDMKRSLKLPRDQTLHTAMDTVLRKIIVYDKDSDVQERAYRVSEELACIQKGCDSTRTNGIHLTTEEEEDLKKEDEEKELIAKEEKERKEEEAKTGKGNEKKTFIGGGKKEVHSKIPSSTKGTGILKTQSSGGLKDVPQQFANKRTPVSTILSGNTSNKALNGISKCKQRSLCLIKAKSTTNIPSLIPRTERRPSTPPKKESLRRIPVLVGGKTASSQSGSTSNKKLSPTPTRNVVTSVTPGVPSISGTLSTSRRGSNNSSNSASLTKPGSLINTSNTSNENIMKVKSAVTPAKASNPTAPEGTVARVIKKPSK